MSASESIQDRLFRRLIEAGLDQEQADEIATEFDRVVAVRMVEKMGSFAARMRAEEVLSPREFQVLELVADDVPSKSIADRLGISTSTVDVHKAAIRNKLGCRTTAGAIGRISVQRSADRAQPKDFPNKTGEPGNAYRAA